MKDFMGNTLEVGDTVLVMKRNHNNTPSFGTGVVRRFTEKRVWVKMHNVRYVLPLRQDPQKVVKMTSIQT